MANSNGVCLTLLVVSLMHALDSSKISQILTFPLRAAHVRGVFPCSLWASIKEL
jgi:hypothetical protein